MADVRPFRRPEAKDDEASRVYSQISQAKQVLLDLRQQWYDAVAFVRGDQWSYWDQGARRIRQRPQLPWRIRVVDNQTLPLIMQQQALLMERQPTFEAMPVTDEEDDRLACHAFEGLLRYHWDRLELTDKLGDALRSALITGNGFWRVDWDAHAGTPVMVPLPPGSDLAGAREAPKKGDAAPDESAGNAATAPDQANVQQPFVIPGETPPAPAGPPAPSARKVFTGDVNVTVVSPFSMHVDPVARSLMEARWVCQESYVHVDTLTDLFGSKGGAIAPDIGPDEYYNFELALRFDAGWVYGVSQDVKDQVRVLEFWEAPTKGNDDGRVLTIANGRTLDSRKNPYEGRYPFVHFAGIKVDGRFWADGFVKHLRPLQTMHNRALSRFHEIMNLMGNPKWVVDKNAGIKETSINDRPGEVISKNPGSTIVAVPPPPPPTIHPQIMSIAQNSMQGISGINDPLAGNNPPNVRSGRTVSFLQEAAMRRFVLLALQTEGSIRGAGRLALYLTQRFYSEDRTIRVLGADAVPEVISMKRADIARVADVTVVHGSLIPRSKAAMQESVLDLIQKAPMLFMDKAGRFDSDRIFQLMDLPAADQRWTPDRADRAQALLEHIHAEGNQPLTVLPMEDHHLHMNLHRGYILSQRARKNPTAMQAVMKHYAEHQMALMQGQGPPQAQPPMLPGGPGGPPPPGGGPGPPGGGSLGGGPPPPGGIPPSPRPDIPEPRRGLLGGSR